MALSRRQTTIAVLRGILGPIHGQEMRFAKLVGRSPSWVKKVSAGIVPLTEEAALIVSGRTGVSFQWLLGPAHRPPFCVGMGTPGEKYTPEYSQWYRSEIGAGHLVTRYGYSPFMFVPPLIGMGFAAGAKGKAALFMWRLNSFIEQMREEFGVNQRAKEIAELLLEHAGKATLEPSGAGVNLQDLWFMDKERNPTLSSFGPEGSALREIIDKGIENININTPKSESRLVAGRTQKPFKAGSFLKQRNAN